MARPLWITTKQVGEEYQLFKKLLQRLRKEQHIIGRKVGKKFLYSRESIESYLNADASGTIPRELSKMVLSPEDEKNLERENNMKWKKGKTTRINMGDFSLLESKGNGGFIYYIDYYDETEKKRHTKNLGKLAKELKIDRGIIADRKAAEVMGRKVRNALFEQERSQDLKKKDSNFAEFAEFYLASQDGKKANSLETVRSVIVGEKTGLIKFFGHLKLSDLNIPETMKYVQHLRNNSIKDSTIGNYLTTFGAMINFARRYLYDIKEKENIIHIKDYHLKTEKRERELEPDEQEALFQVANPFWKRLLRVELDTGLRLMNVSDPDGLRWDWVDFESRMITIPKEHAKGKEDIEIYMTSLVEEILKHIKGENPGDKFVFMRKVNGNGRQPLNERWIQNEFKNMTEKVGIEDLHFHDLRRTFAMRLVRKGVDVLTLKGCLGHKNINSTMAYVTEDPKLIRKAFLSLDREEGVQ